MLDNMLGFIKNKNHKTDKKNDKFANRKIERAIDPAELTVHLRSLGKVSKKEDFLPSGTMIRGSTTKEYGISRNGLSAICVVSLNSLEVALLVTEKCVGTPMHINLRNTIIDKGLKITVERISDVSYVALLNNAITADVDDDKGSDSSALVEEIIQHALREKSPASDIHICCREKSGMVLMRVNSKLRRYKQYPVQTCVNMASFMYSHLSLPTSRSDTNFNVDAKSLSCMIETTHKGSFYKLRYKFISMADGWDVIIRILPVESPGKKPPKFDQLGYEKSQIEQIELAVRRSIGLVAITGPTGSGKSTSLKTMMEFDPNRMLKKRYSIEDPVEYKIYGVSQISLQRNDHEKDGSNASFTGVLRDILRADPNDVMVGETRDMSTASMLADAVLTGHKMYTTLHTASAIGAYLRLSRLGLDRHVLADRQFVAAMIFQRLMPVMCPHCKIKAYENNKLTTSQVFHISRTFEIDLDNIYVTNHAGCEHCDGGIYKSTVVAEVITPDAVLRDFILRERDAEAENYWRKSKRTPYSDPCMDGKTAFEHAIYKMSLGLIDPNDIEEEFESFQTYQVVPLDSV